MLNPPEAAATPAQTCTRTAAAAGNADAQFALAFYLAAGPAPQDYAQAMEWYVKAADQDHRLAQFNLGQMYAHGQGIPKSEPLALLWIRRAADGGDAGAQFAMGERCGRASLDKQETQAAEARVESFKWFTLAAAQNYRDALARCDFATLRMTRDEVAEANRRARTFVAA